MSVIKKNIPGVSLCICAFFTHSAMGQQTVQGALSIFTALLLSHRAMFILTPKILI